MTIFHRTAAAALLAWAVATGTAWAQDGNRPPPPGEGHREPPAEAFTACAGKAEGDTVTLTMPDGRTMTGTCAKLPDGRLAARPPRMGPPPTR
ncbi:hypothetical protein [Xylophilus sp. Leaf220]|uniref:hypothetical protein n=1 Tax=Xylophilus sp. Leaf220 TaxID=1735686 RepID=UPI0006F2156B|nr:hypothetical protein [Xylophilus sp. Leaf220]KQM71322.1 hypothetical protein ASE76_08960 [Xylophilus sp. Leaf220]